MTRKSRPAAPGAQADDTIEAMIRVDHAGEYATKIKPALPKMHMSRLRIPIFPPLCASYGVTCPIQPISVRTTQRPSGERLISLMKPRSLSVWDSTTS